MTEQYAELGGGTRTRKRSWPIKRNRRYITNVGVCTDCWQECDADLGPTHGGNCALKPLEGMKAIS